MTEITIKSDTQFSFKSTPFSHGWIDLAPFRLLSDQKKLTTSFKYAGNIYQIRIASQTDQNIIVSLDTKTDDAFKKYLSAMIKHMFRLDEDYSQFYSRVNSSEDYAWISEKSAGRMFRCATLWEDMVKILCTTNCTWHLTRIMVNNLVEKIGSGVFPAPEEVAGKSEKYLRDEIKMGYRSPYLLELSRSIAEGSLNLDTFTQWPGDTSGLYIEMRKIKGLGDYAVSNLLKLLGCYDYYGSDSWSRKKFSEKYLNGKECTEKDISKRYDHLGKWRGLFFWLDMTRDWYEREIPW